MARCPGSVQGFPRRLRMIEDAAQEDHAQDAAHILIERGLADLAGSYRSCYFVGGKPTGSVAGLLGFRFRDPLLHRRTAGHLEIHAGVDRRRRGIGASPIGNDESLEAELVAQNVIEKRSAFGAVDAVDFVVSRHHRPRTRLLDRSLERG